MPSVTEILDYLTDKELLKWIENNSKAKRKNITDSAIRVGKEVDLLVQQDIKEGGYLVPEGNEPITNCLKAWELFKKENPQFVSSVKSMQTELRKGELVGHPDFIIEDAYRFGVIDLKCSRAIMPRHWTQTAKYLDLVKSYATKRSPTCKEFIGILRLDKTTGLYEYKEMRDPDDIAYEVYVFDAYYTTYQHNFNNREIIRQQLEEELLNVS